MAEIKVTLDAKYNKPAGDVDAVQKESILPTLQGLCTGPEYNSAKEDICDALKLLITYPEGLDEDEEDIKKREGRGVMEPNKVVSSPDLIIASTADVSLGQSQIETYEICSVTHAHCWIQVLL